MTRSPLGGLLYRAARPALFALDAERAHDLTLCSLSTAAATGMLGMIAGARVEDPVRAMGLDFPNRVGLAAGLDKNGAHVDALAGMGFGFIEVGTVTPRAQPGNPRPRMFRLPQREALINRMGFNNDGVDRFVANVRRARYRGILGLNIGKNADTPIERAMDDYLLCLTRVYPHASYVTINVSSPNTRDLRRLQGADAIGPLLDGLGSERDKLAREHGRRVPLALKIAPDLAHEEVDAIAEALVRHRADAVIATNTTVSRESVAGLVHADEAGGLSGAPLRDASDRVIRRLRSRLGPDYPIIGVGGVMSGDDAQAKIEAGATLVQLYTGLVYRGPSLVGDCARAIRSACASTATRP